MCREKTTLDSKKMHFKFKYLYIIILLTTLIGCSGEQQVPAELRKAIDDISNMGEVQTAIEKEVMSKSIGVFKKYAEKGNPVAMYWFSEARLLDKKDQNYITTEESLKWLRKAAEKGHVSALLELADIYSGDKKLKNPEKAYFWFYIGYYKKDGMVHALNEKPDADPVPGDFRNESVISDLVKELGVPKLKEIEKQAQAWLAKHPEKLKETPEILKN